MTEYRYALGPRLIHWAVVVLVLYSLASGLTLGALGFEGARDAFGANVTNFLYTYHKTSGVLILGLMLLRLAARFAYGKPAYVNPLSPARRIASEAVHGLLYIMLLIQPVLGWLATASGDFPVQFFAATLPGLIGVNEDLSHTLFFWHGIVAWIILGLITVHIAAALYHRLVLRDEVMHRMTLP
ncbi:MAG: cytochrome b/b6 domain-containing protein [Aquisalimonadaceae bacterium]